MPKNIRNIEIGKYSSRLHNLTTEQNVLTTIQISKRLKRNIDARFILTFTLFVMNKFGNIQTKLTVKRVKEEKYLQTLPK